MKIAEDIIREKKNRIISVTAETTIIQALRVMVKENIGAMLIQAADDPGEIIGIWTERDLMRDMIKPGFDCNTAKIGDFMQTQLLKAPHTTPIYHLLDKFIGLNIRHLIVEKEGRFLGLLSQRDVSRANLVEKTEELQKLNAMVSWEYYENWKWNSPKGR